MSDGGYKGKIDLDLLESSASRKFREDRKNITRSLDENACNEVENNYSDEEEYQDGYVSERSSIELERSLERLSFSAPPSPIPFGRDKPTLKRPIPVYPVLDLTEEADPERIPSRPSSRSGSGSKIHRGASTKEPPPVSKQAFVLSSPPRERAKVKFVPSSVEFILPPQHQDEILKVYPHRYYHHEPEQSEWQAKQFGNIRYAVTNLLFLIRTWLILSFVNPLNLFVIFLAVAATLVCYELELTTDLPTSFLSFGIIFPISFVVSYSNNRRESNLGDMASLRASMIALYQCVREWSAPDEAEDTKPGAKTFTTFDFVKEYKALLHCMVHDIKMFMTHKGGKEHLYRIYRAFDKMSRMHEGLRRKREWVRSVVSRAYQYQRYMMVDFERLRVVHDYRSVSVLRAYSLVTLTFFPALCAPYFAFLSEIYGIWSGVYTAILTAFMLGTLYTIQSQLEDPFSDFGPDTINLDALDEPRECHMWELEELPLEDYYYEK